MNGYSAEQKESVIQKMMPPHNVPIPQLAEAAALLVLQKKAQVTWGDGEDE